MKFLFWRIKIKLNKLLIKYSKNKRPGCSPFITGDDFRSIADFIFDETTIKFIPSLVKEHSTVFVNTDFLEIFFKEYHPLIQNPYVLISHNSDKNIDLEKIKYIDGKIIHWFAQNVLIKHPKITPIPIGLENKHHGRTGDQIKFIHKLKKKKLVKENKIFVCFTVSTNTKERNIALNKLLSNPLSKIFKEKNTQKEYTQELSKSTFVASPPGNGEDCHRTWEALYLNTVPIVKRSTSTEYFNSLGLPLYITEDWNILDLQVKEDYTLEALSFNFWKNKIKNI